MAGSLLHGPGGGRLRRAPSSKLQERYKSSENLSQAGGAGGGAVPAVTAPGQGAAKGGAVAAAMAVSRRGFRVNG